MKALVAALLAAIAALPLAARAQVGHTPESSPYRDLEFRHALTLYGGQFNAGKDPAGVAPQSGPLLGVRYDWRLGGPATFTARAAHVWSQREIVDPEAAAAARRLGVQDWSLYLADIGFTIALTGRKSYYRLVPLLYGGLGVASDFKGRDLGGYKFGTAFALAFGAGVRWVPTGRLELRADVGDHLYQIKYPSSYYEAGSDGTQVLPGTRPQSLWKHNASLTLGAAYQLFR